MWTRDRERVTREGKVSEDLLCRGETEDGRLIIQEGKNSLISSFRSQYIILVRCSR